MLYVTDVFWFLMFLSMLLGRNRRIPPVSPTWNRVASFMYNKNAWSHHSSACSSWKGKVFVDQLSSKVHSPPPPPCLCVDCSDQTHWSSVFLPQESDSSWFRLFMVWKGRLDCWKEKRRRERCLESAAVSVVRAFFLPPVPVPQSPPMAGNLSHRQPTIARCSYVSTNPREKKWDFRAQFRDFPVISTDCNVHNVHCAL